MPAAYTDMLNVSLDTLTTTLQEITGISVVNDPRNVNPPCALISAPSIESYNNKIVKLVYSCQVITLGPGNLDAERSLLNIVAKLIDKNVAVMTGRPTSVDIGGAMYPAYELTINVQAQSI